MIGTKLVEVQLLTEWLGHPKKARFKVSEGQANSMIGRGVAKVYVPWKPLVREEPVMETKIETSTEEKKEEPVSKMVRRDKDKMIKGSETK